MSGSQDNIDRHDRSAMRYSPVSKSKAVIKFVADRGLPIIALVASAIALTVVLLDRSDANERFERVMRESDARWIAALNESTSRWNTTHHELDTKWQDSQRKSDIQWQETFRRSDAQWTQAYKTMERELRLVQQDYGDVKVEFLSRGMNPHPHTPGESQ